MPIHDWTRVRQATFHDFHSSWITHIKESLNGGVLPKAFYALAEQPADDVWPDVLALETASNGDEPLSPPSFSEADGEGGVAVAECAPNVSLTMTTEANLMTYKQKRLAIHHASGDRIVALLEIVSPGNKSHAGTVARFVRKAVDAMFQGYHLLVLDLLPPSPYDPQGIHGAIWHDLTGPGDDPYEAPSDKPLTLVSYEARPALTAFVEPTAVATALVDMPLFFDVGMYVNVPLESTYMEAWRGVPERWRRVIEAEP